jgi:hypothetical protein
MNEHLSSDKKSLFESGIDLMLTGTPYALWHLVETFASEIMFEDWAYEVWLENTHSSQPKFLVRVIRGKRERDNVGIIMLQSTGQNETLLHIPPLEQWDIFFFPCCYYRRLFFLPLHFSPKNFNKRVDESFFIYFLQGVFTKLQQLGFLSTGQKPPMGFSLPHKEKNV